MYLSQASHPPEIPLPLLPGATGPHLGAHSSCQFLHLPVNRVMFLLLQLRTLILPTNSPIRPAKKPRSPKNRKRTRRASPKRTRGTRSPKSITRNLASRVLPRRRNRVGLRPPLPAREFFAMLRDAARVQVNKSSSTTQSGILVAWLVRRCKCGTRCPPETVAKQSTRRQACRRVPADFS